MKVCSGRQSLSEGPSQGVVVLEAAEQAIRAKTAADKRAHPIVRIQSE